MAGDWKEGFKRAIIDVLVRQGIPVRDRPDFYGWEDYEHYFTGSGGHPKRDKVARVGVDYAATTYVESCWDEFMGTFYEGDTRVYGVDLHLVLTDGTEYQWRYAGTVSELIAAVLADGEAPDQG